MGKLGLTVAYLIPLILIAWVWVGRGGGGRPRIVILALLPLVYIGHWKFLEQYEGWPTDGKLPQQFELIGADINEPNVQKNSDGRIHMWIKVAPDDPPRSYELPYSRELHELLHASLNRLKQGVRQSGATRGREQNGKGVSVGNALELIIDDRSVRALPPKSI